jgi:tetratricopeptide (TPR) repeat protein
MKTPARVLLAPFAACTSLALAATGCPPPPGETLANLTLPPPRIAADGTLAVTADDRDAHVYAFYLADPASPARREEREALLAFTLYDAQRSLEEDGTLGVGATLAAAFRLLDPQELDARVDSPALRKLLEWIEPLALRIGKPEDSLVVAHARLLLDPDDGEASATVGEIVDWAVATAGGEEDEASAIERRAELYDAVTMVLPVPQLVKNLIGWVFRRHELGPPDAAALESLEDWFLAARRDQFYFSGLTLNVLRLCARVGRPEAAIDALEPYRGSSAYLGEVLEEVARMGEPQARAEAGADIAEALAPQFPEEARRLCTDLRREYPEDGRFADCLGRYYAGLGEYGIAARFFLEAMSKDPDERGFADTALQLLAGEIQAGTDQASWEALQGLHAAFQQALARYRAAWPQADPPVEETLELRLMANAALVEGDVDAAREFHRTALARHPSAGGYFEFGQMEARAGNPARAMELFEAGLAVGTGDLAERLLAQADIHEEIGLLRAAQGDTEGAKAAFEDAVDAWRELARAGAVTEARADVQVGTLLHRMGRRDEGLRRIALGLREASEDDYGPGEDAVAFNAGLSFLHLEGERDLLVELYPLVATREDLDVAWRVYYALWTLGAGRRAGRPDDPEVLVYLRAVRAGGWTGTLARFYGGELDFAGALAQARSIGQETEARYYEALNRLAAGDRESALALLRQVVDTRIYNYFEWEMARRVLADLEAGEQAGGR